MFVIRADDPSKLHSGQQQHAAAPNPTLKGFGGKGLAGNRSGSVLSDVSNKLARIAATPAHQISKQHHQMAHKPLCSHNNALAANIPHFQTAKFAQQHEMMMKQKLSAMKPLPKSQPLGKKGKKKRTGKKVAVVQGYTPALSPLVENAWGELMTPAREKLQRELQEAQEEALRGKLVFDDEREQEHLVVTALAQIGQKVVIAKKFASDHTFRRFLGRTGVIIRKSETPGGGGCIVDFGEKLGRQFLSSGGSGVYHLAYPCGSSSNANTNIPSSSSSSSSFKVPSLPRSLQLPPTPQAGAVMSNPLAAQPEPVVQPRSGGGAVEISDPPAPISTSGIHRQMAGHAQLSPLLSASSAPPMMPLSSSVDSRLVSDAQLHASFTRHQQQQHAQQQQQQQQHHQQQQQQQQQHYQHQQQQRQHNQQQQHQQQELRSLSEQFRHHQQQFTAGAMQVTAQLGFHAPDSSRRHAWGGSQQLQQQGGGGGGQHQQHPAMSAAEAMLHAVSRGSNAAPAGSTLVWM